MNERKETDMINEDAFDYKTAKKSFSRIGFALLVTILAGIALQMIFMLLPPVIWGEDNWLSASSWGMWIMTFVPLYAIAMPLGLLTMKRLPKAEARDERLGAKTFLSYVPVCFFLMYAGSIIGNILSLSLSGGAAQNALLDYAMDTNPLKILVIVVLAPLLEELVFRKQLIDRTRQYGEKWAVMLSGISFALFHTNLFQFFYAFALGVLFGYIYVRTSRLRYTVLLHCIVNFLGSVVAPWILSLLDLEALSAIDIIGSPDAAMGLIAENLSGILVYGLYICFMMLMSVWGLVLFIMKIGKLRWEEAESELPKGHGFKTAYLNAGMILFVVFCFGATMAALFV